MFGPKIKITSGLLERLKQAAELVGCSSVDEYVERVLSAESEKVLSSSSQRQSGEASQGDVEAISKKLKGLGYLE